jgi:hypothetical protein
VCMLLRVFRVCLSSCVRMCLCSCVLMFMCTCVYVYVCLFVCARAYSCARQRHRVGGCQGGVDVLPDHQVYVHPVWCRTRRAFSYFSSFFLPSTSTSLSAAGLPLLHTAPFRLQDRRCCKSSRERSSLTHMNARMNTPHTRTPARPHTPHTRESSSSSRRTFSHHGDAPGGGGRRRRRQEREFQCRGHGGG